MLFVPRGTNISYTKTGGRNIFCGGGGHDDVDEETDVSQANFLVIEASRLCAGARIFNGL